LAGNNIKNVEVPLGKEYFSIRIYKVICVIDSPEGMSLKNSTYKKIDPRLKHARMTLYGYFEEGK
jgi:hypothetical protein